MFLVRHVPRLRDEDRSSLARNKTGRVSECNRSRLLFEDQKIDKGLCIDERCCTITVENLWIG